MADAAWALQSSALATISAIVAAVGRGVLPVLPRLVPAVLSAADAATSELCGPEQPAPDIADMELDGTEAQKSDDDMELLPQSANGSSLKMRWVFLLWLMLHPPLLFHSALSKLPAGAEYIMIPALEEFEWTWL